MGCPHYVHEERVRVFALIGEAAAQMGYSDTLLQPGEEVYDQAGRQHPQSTTDDDLSQGMGAQAQTRPSDQWQREDERPYMKAESEYQEPVP